MIKKNLHVSFMVIKIGNGNKPVLIKNAIAVKECELKKFSILILEIFLFYSLKNLSM